MALDRFDPVASDTLNLSGRVILYVGGRHQHVAHLRRLIETFNGIFTHHDGGVEESMNALASLLERADAVLLPVGCVSHQAQTRAKRTCRRFNKPFKPLRSTGLGSITDALRSVAAETTSALSTK